MESKARRCCLLLSCQSGSWKKAQVGGSGGFFSIGNGGYKLDYATLYASPSCSRINTRTGACSCPSGSSPVIAIADVTAATCCIPASKRELITCE